MTRLRTLAANWTWGHTALTFALVFALFRILGPISEADLYWHLLMGHHVATTGDLAGDPSVTFGAHQDWVTTQAVSEVFGYWWFQLTGWSGFVFLRIFGGFLIASAVAWASYALTPRAMKQSLRLWISAFAVGLAMQFPNVQERPQTFTFILMPIVGFVLIRMVYTGRTPNLLATFAVVAGWTWMHGGSLLVAPILLGGWALRLLALRFGWLGASGHNAGFVWRGPAVAGAAFLGTLVNPLGWRLYEQGTGIANSALSVGITEWTRPWPDYPAMAAAMVLVLVLLGVAVALLWRRSFPRRVFIVDVLLILPFLLYSETANRAVPVAVFIVVPLVARRWAQAVNASWHSPVRSYVPWAALPVAAAIAAVTVGLTAYATATTEPVGEETPRRIVSGLAQTVGERNVAGSYNLSGVLQLLTQPEVRTGLDGRADRYSPEQLSAFREMRRGVGDWENTFSTDFAGATDYVDLVGLGIVPKLKERGWRVVCEEDTSYGRYVWLAAPGVSGSCPAEPLPLVANVDR